MMAWFLELQSGCETFVIMIFMFSLEYGTDTSLH